MNERRRTREQTSGQKQGRCPPHTQSEEQMIKQEIHVPADSDNDDGQQAGASLLTFRG